MIHRLTRQNLFRLLTMVGMVAFTTTSVRSETAWSEIIEGRTFEEGIKLENRENVLIRNCRITNPNGTFGIHLQNCRNVRIEGCVIRRIGDEKLLEKTRMVKGYEYHTNALDKLAAISLNDCNTIFIVGNEITDSQSKGIAVHASESKWKEPVDTLIENNRIAYIVDDGIDFGVATPGPVKDIRYMFSGITIRNNLIHDIGLGLTKLGFARHAIYLSTRDAIVEGNTIYNCFYGEGISIRNSAVVRNNKVWNCARSCISYWAQGVTDGGTRTVLVEGNECRQDFMMNFPMRHISTPAKIHTLPLTVMGWQYSDSPFTKMDSVTFRNNTLHMGRDYHGNQPVMGGSGAPGNSPVKITISNNKLKDDRPKPVFFGNLRKDIISSTNYFEPAPPKDKP